MSEFKIIETETFDSLGKFLAAINSRENNDMMKYEHSSKKNDSSFSNCKSYEQAVEYATKGWEEKLSEIKAQFINSVKTNANGAIDRRRTYNHVVGYAPNVPNAILGLPQSMICSHKEPQKVKVVSLIYAPDANCGTSADTFIKAGIVILNIVNRLELNGVRVNLKIAAYDATSYNSGYAGCYITVKDYREPLDLKKIAFPIAHPAMLRRLGFKWIETFPNLKGDYTGGYGHTVSGDNGHRERLIEMGLLRETDYFTSLERVEERKFNIDEVMKDAGIKL